MNTITFSDFLRIAKITNKGCEHLRRGQMMYNNLYLRYRDLANEITATGFDPFYDDNKIGAFLNFLYSRIDPKAFINIS